MSRGSKKRSGVRCKMFRGQGKDCSKQCIEVKKKIVLFFGLLFFSTPKCLFLDPAIGPSCFRPRHVFFSTSSFFSAPQ